MKDLHGLARVMIAGLIAFGIGGRVWGEEPSLPQPGGSANLTMTKHYIGSLSSVGNFPGRLVRLSCPSGDARTPSWCGKTDHALVVEGDETVHPLLPGTEEVRTELNEPDFQEADVRVHGRYYPTTGAILISRIAQRCATPQC